MSQFTWDRIFQNIGSSAAYAQPVISTICFKTGQLDQSLDYVTSQPDKSNDPTVYIMQAIRTTCVLVTQATIRRK